MGKHTRSMPTRTVFLALCALSATLCACASNQTDKTNTTSSATVTQGAQRADTPLPAETSPPGDIPDSQAFVVYTFPDRHVTIAYPEGWERTSQPAGVTFVHEFSGERIRKGSGISGASAVRDLKSATARVPSGVATLLTYSSNSLPNAVTGKRVRLLNNTYIFKTPSGPVALDLWAPLGSDNVDQWKHLASTFKAR
ncbi:MAG: hypothetical protein ABI231_00590 [Candidatus Tumulicola sp.]